MKKTAAIEKLRAKLTQVRFRSDKRYIKAKTAVYEAFKDARLTSLDRDAVAESTAMQKVACNRVLRCSNNRLAYNDVYNLIYLT